MLLTLTKMDGQKKAKRNDISIPAELICPPKVRQKTFGVYYDRKEET